MTKTWPKVSIIFPNFNGGQEPLDCLDSIAKLDYPRTQLEVVVIDNGSNDGSPEQIKKRFPKVKLTRLKHNLGFAKAVNLGIKKSHGQYIFIANDDLVFDRDSLKKLLSYALGHPSVGVLGGQIYLKSAPKQLISSGFMLNRWTGDIKRNLKVKIVFEPDWVQGCAMLIPAKVLKRIGLLDTGFEHLFEDVDFCLRAKKAGFQVVYLPEAIFWHGESLTADKNKIQKYRYWYRGKIRFILKHLPLWNILSIMFIQILIIMPYRAIILKDGRLGSFGQGLGWNIRHLTKTLKLRSS